MRMRADLALFAQDRWTISRLTLNYGLRFDYFNGYVPEQSTPASTFVPAREFAAVHNVPNWKDVNPRLGASYDLFGNGRTALTDVAGPLRLSGNHRPHRRREPDYHQREQRQPDVGPDANGNYVPDCDLTNPRSTASAVRSRTSTSGRTTRTRRGMPTT